jgi:hypothetical protein
VVAEVAQIMGQQTQQVVMVAEEQVQEEDQTHYQ